MARIVMKFGGTSVVDIERICRVAERVKAQVNQGDEVAVAVSAMAGETDQLVAKVDQVGGLYDLREYDVVVSSGEQVTVGLLAIAFLMAWLRRASFAPFVVYRVLLGVALLVLIYGGWISLGGA